MKNRSIEKIVSPQEFNWVGNAFYTTSFIGGKIPRNRMSPFFAIGYNAEIEFEASEIPRGVGAHPHKGFETVTIAYKGKIEHKDSHGNHGIIGEGDVQWMTAGAGILHEEYHEENYSKTGGPFQMVQLWVNLPAKFKHVKPSYQELTYDNMSRVNLPNDGGFVNIVAGNYEGVQGKATTYSDMHLFNAYLKKGGKLDLAFPNHYNTAFLVIQGSISVNEEDIVKKDQFVLMENGTSDVFNITSLEDDTIVLLLSGDPINEPIAHYGPFVMNTQEEIIAAIEEFNSGKFGQL